jgi:hypothetical protein
LLDQRKSKGVRNVLLDSCDDSLETLIVFTFSEYLESCFLVDNIIWVEEDDIICQESSSILTEVRDVILASLEDMQKTWERRTISRQVGNLISGINHH